MASTPFRPAAGLAAKPSELLRKELVLRLAVWGSRHRALQEYRKVGMASAGGFCTMPTNRGQSRSEHVPSGSEYVGCLPGVPPQTRVGKA